MKLIRGTNFINCCPHDIQVMDKEGKVHLIPEDKESLLRVNTIMSHGSLAGFEDEAVSSLCIENLPEEQERTIYIVSNPVLQVLKRAGIKRTDFRGLGRKIEQTNYRKGFVSL